MIKFRQSSIILLALIMLLSVSACKKKEEPKADKKKAPVEKALQPEEPEKIPANENLLTGLPDLTDGAIGKRPVAVMINNVSGALPQYGIEKADIIYEIPVEGDVTRLMAIYADYTTVPQIAPIRSSRYYFPALSQGYDAFYVNWGIDDSIAGYLEALQLDQFDGIHNGGGLFGRDQARLNAGYSLEHTGFFDGPRFAEVVQSEGRRIDLEADKKGTAFLFNGMDDQVKPQGDDCSVLDINFGGATATFDYDELAKTYSKKINGEPQMDNATNKQIAFTNVFVLETEISIRSDLGHKSVDWDGSDTATGYYISNGGVQKIRWNKEADNEKSYLRFYDESGKEIQVNRGKSYIAMNYPDQVTFQ